MPALQAMLQRLLRFEPYIFLLLLLAHVSVLFRFPWYPTLDGPAHLYNAHLIRQMMLGNEFLARYFEFSSFPEPNWSGHAIMAFLSLFLPANWVEKGMVLTIFIGTAIAFRALVFRYHRPTFATLLIFPFLCTFSLRIGFFNFSLSIAVFLAILAWWHGRTRSRAPTIDQGIFLCLLLGLLYFSHALTSVVCFGTLLLITIVQLKISNESVRIWKRSIGTLLIAMMPWTLLIILFILKAGNGTAATYQSAARLLSIAMDGVPFTLHYGPAMIWAARTMAIILIAGSAWLIVHRWRWSRHRLIATDIWLLLSVGAAGAYAIMPDQAATGGIISVRYLQFMYLFLAIWLAVQREWPVVMHLLIAPYLLASLYLVRVDHGFTRDLNADVVAVRTMLPHIADDSAVLPLVHSKYWFHGNISNYLGTERGILVLDNYEAMAPHFPLRWKEEHRPPPAERTFYNSDRPCITIDTLAADMRLPLHHVFRWKHHLQATDSCTLELSRQLHAGFLHQRQGEAEMFTRLP